MKFNYVVHLLVLVQSAAISRAVLAAGEDEQSIGSLDIPAVEVSAEKKINVPVSGLELDQRQLQNKRSMTLDAVQLLEDAPGVSVYSAGAISGLPAIHGLADERLKIEVDGMDMSAACPNHMNSVLSYIAPTRVGNIKVFSGITPVSEGGDSLGGTVQVSATQPRFASEGGHLVNGSLGSFYRSNGYAHGWNASAGFATDQLSIQYTESRLDASNYRAAKDFKDPAKWQGVLQNGLQKTDLDEVGSSAISGSINRAIDIALKHDVHLLQLGISRQTVGFEGFPNQRMDMTDNENTSFNLRYRGLFDWGDIEAKLFRQRVTHAMDMSYERSYALPAMPMLSEATTKGGSLKVSLPVTNDHLVKLGGDFKYYDLDDWWPPVAAMGPGSMCCDNFWNIRNGKRDRVGLFSELESHWQEAWTTLLGVRSDVINSDAGLAQGYSDASYKADADRFNSQSHGRRNLNWDWTALARYTPDRNQTYEFGLARKSRAPSLYERYPWSSFTMAALMNNFAGDGNAYIGNLSLDSEIAHTLNATVDWHDEQQSLWGAKLNAYVTYVDDYIDAVRCSLVSCGVNNTTKTNAYVTLQYENQSARLHGFDFSAFRYLSQGSSGAWSTKAIINYVRGENTTTGNNLYHMMPLNGRFSLQHVLGGWTSTAEVQLVSAKTHVSQVRNETQTDGYGLLNLRTSYSNKFMRVDLGLDNALNKLYFSPLGGAYLGQGFSMTSGFIPWGVNLPGMGRSANVAVTFFY